MRGGSLRLVPQLTDGAVRMWRFLDRCRTTIEYGDLESPGVDSNYAIRVALRSGWGDRFAALPGLSYRVQYHLYPRFSSTPARPAVTIHFDGANGEPLLSCTENAVHLDATTARIIDELPCQGRFPISRPPVCETPTW